MSDGYVLLMARSGDMSPIVPCRLGVTNVSLTPGAPTALWETKGTRPSLGSKLISSVSGAILRVFYV